MYTTLKKLNEGFTIVETLIVLAIAALIITIILIAVPDLQRSSRNTDILHDAQNVASAVQTYEGNNQGSIPYVTSGTYAAPTTNPQTGPSITMGASGAVATAHVQATDTIYVSNGGNAVKYTAPGCTASGTVICEGVVVVDTQSTCGSTGNTNITSGNPRQVAVLYPIEGSSTTTSTVGCTQE